MIWYDGGMIRIGVLLVLLAQITESTRLPAVPAPPGVYYLQDGSTWMKLQSAVVSDADAKGMDLFVDTGGFTDFGMHVACRGPRASLRILLEKPTFYAREICPVKDAMLIRLTKKKDSRAYNTSFSNVTVENKGGFRKKDITKLVNSENPDGSVSLSPEKPLEPGEYLLVCGNASPAYDFGVDKAK